MCEDNLREEVIRGIKVKKYWKHVFYKIYVMVRNTSVFSRLMIGFLLVILIPAFIVIMILYKNVEKEFYRSGVSYIYQNLDNTVQKTYETYRQYENQLYAVLENDKIASYLLEGDGRRTKVGISEVLEEGMNHFACENLFVITEDAVYIIREGNSGREGVLLVDEKRFRNSDAYKESIASPLATNWFNTIHENDMYYTNGKQQAYLGNYLTLTCKIMDGKKVLGLLVANIDTARVSGIADFDKVYNQDLFLIDKDGLITYLNVDYVYRDYPEQVWKTAVENESTVTKCRVEGKDMLFFVENLGKSDLHVVSAILKENLLEASYKLRRQHIIIVFDTILASLVICFVVTFSISYPLKKIGGAMKRYAQKDFRLDLQDEGADQITKLSQYFLDMSLRIEELAEKGIQAEIDVGAEKVKQKEMKLSALQMQINPHFLYNTLDLIRWNVVGLENGNDRVSRMIGSYSTLLRYNIRLGEGFATIREEIEYTRKYVRLLDMLYDIQIHLTVNTGDADISSIKIGKLFFQPIIENAMIHGKLNTMESPLLEIDVEEGNTLKIHIMNNGRKMTEEKQQQLNAEISSFGNEAVRVGLYNVNQRIRLLFGEDYGLTVGERKGMVCFTFTLSQAGEEEVGE